MIFLTGKEEKRKIKEEEKEMNAMLTGTQNFTHYAGKFAITRQ